MSRSVESRAAILALTWGPRWKIINFAVLLTGLEPVFSSLASSGADGLDQRVLVQRREGTDCRGKRGAGIKGEWASK